MQLELERGNLELRTESALEEAYVEVVLGLRAEGDYCKLVRRNSFQLKQRIVLYTAPKDTAFTKADIPELELTLRIFIQNKDYASAANIASVLAALA